jgi:hypothetical protein
MDIPPSLPQKKGLGPLAWVGIGCGSLVLLGVIALIVVGFIAGPKLKKFAEDAQANPTRMVANTMATVASGQMEMVAEDDVNKRYTVRAKKDGKLTTIYWDAKKNAPEVIEGDFSAIPAVESAPAEPPPEPEAK